MTHRLHVHELTSIGVVEAGDNPEADIMFWKRRPDQPRGGRREGTLPARPSVAAVFAKVARTLAEARRSLASIDETGSRREVMAQPTMTAETIADTVTKRAAAMRQAPRMWDRSEVELRADLWKRTPGLRDLYSAAMRDPDGFAKSVSGEHAEALAIAKRWSDDPATGLS